MKQRRSKRTATVMRYHHNVTCGLTTADKEKVIAVTLAPADGQLALVRSFIFLVHKS
jgi:hypothetical protein